MKIPENFYNACSGDLRQYECINDNGNAFAIRISSVHVAFSMNLMAVV